MYTFNWCTEACNINATDISVAESGDSYSFFFRHSYRGKPMVMVVKTY